MNEYRRQAAHLVIGTGVAAILLLPFPGAATLIYASGLLGGLVLIETLIRGYHIPGISELVADLERDGAFPGKGSMYFVASALFCSIAFTAETAFVAVLSLAILDAVATMAGLRFGRHTIINGRTLEGSVSGFVALSIILLPIGGPAVALTASGVAAVVELLTPIDDNLVIPPIVGLVLTLLPAV
ncbi:diacylglycerol/polyprenol kinase family protein [Methanofollis fontis]|uniref:Phosphatidate cytidylyltransferase n=1 Tax=Methanofollis fontis TaxID=2052832 RepID=A0A483CTK8_9EURY|nr:hypothetical protein [Methanofollis fontis]TAJ44713.1 hypothetical protein CUJ86_05285 [Methanofollis fontis]